MKNILKTLTFRDGPQYFELSLAVTLYRFRWLLFIYTCNGDVALRSKQIHGQKNWLKSHFFSNKK